MGYWLWGYYGLVAIFPANQLGKSRNVWTTGGYGLSGVWVIGVPTVVSSPSWRSLLTTSQMTVSLVSVRIGLSTIIDAFSEELLIDFGEMKGSHTGENMGAAVWDTMERYGLKEKVWYITFALFSR